jgi:predicted dehydrogenase
MGKFRVAVVGVGSIAQIVHLPVLKKMENVDLVAICDVDEGKVNSITDKFKIPNWYFLIDNLIKSEKLDAVHICTTSHYHFPMSYMALNSGINVLVEKPIALNSNDAEKLVELARKKKLTMLVGMQNRFRDDVQTLREFLKNDELGEIYYIKAGWLKRWQKNPLKAWQTNKGQAGGGVLIDIGSQLIDLALFLTNMPKIRSVRLFDYSLNPNAKVEESALAVIETESHISITIEVSWRMHMENDMVYTHIFGKKGSAYLNPLRIQKELHGNLVNVTPMVVQNPADRYKRASEAEIRHFYNVLSGTEKNLSSAEDAAYVMKMVDALYESAKNRKEIII